MSSFEIFRNKKNKEYTENDISEHYKKLSSRCAVLKWLSLTALIVFVIVSVSQRGDDLSLDNVRYIIRHFGEKQASLVETGDGVAYDYDDKNQAYVIGDDFAIVGNSGIVIFDYAGDILFKDSFNFDSPSAATYGNELILYNVGGKEVRFYNSYTMLKRLSFDSPVYKVSVSDNGNYLIQTATEGYRSGVQVYDDDKDLIFKHNFGELSLQSSAISKNGQFVACASFSSLSNIVSTSLVVYDISQVEPIGQISFDGEYPISIEFINNDFIVLFTNKGVRGYNLDLNMVFFNHYGNRSPQKYKISDDKIVISYTKSLFEQTTEIEIASKKGEVIQTFNVPYSVVDFELEGDYAHILSGSLVETFSLSKNNILNSHETKSKFFHLIKISNNKFMLSSPERAELFIYNN